MESLAFKRFSTLLLREWLQHKTGWIVVACAPVLIAGLVVLVGQVNINIEGRDTMVELSAVPGLVLAAVAIIGIGVLTFVLAWASSLLQTPGLARRDQQDRSIEFWLSLPVGHPSSLAAPLLAHLLLFPLAALGIGMLAGHVVSFLVVSRFVGVSDWFGLPWGALSLAWIALTARAALGLVLATLWLSPLILLVMAASAWLKRWGLPAVLASIAVINGVLDKLYGNPVVWDLGRQIVVRAGQSFVTGKVPGGLQFGQGHDPVAALRAFPGMLLEDAGHAVAALADPLLLLALAVAAAGFGLLVLRRRRGH
jgi:ABC-2 type transport system permease protein